MRIVKGFLRDAERLVGFGSDIPKDLQGIPKGRREVRTGMESDVRKDSLGNSRVHLNPLAQRYETQQGNRTKVTCTETV